MAKLHLKKITKKNKNFKTNTIYYICLRVDVDVIF